MKLVGLIALIAAFVPSLALAQTAPPPMVKFTTQANMPTLKDPSKQDHFDITLSDAQISTTLTVDCTAGRTEMFVVRKDKQCAVTGTGSVINPSNQQAIPRTQYLGSYSVKADGSTEASTMQVNYLPMGRVGASADTFKGSMNLKPELTSTGAAGLAESVMRQIEGSAEGPVNEAIDTVDLNRLFIPSAGLPSDKGCIWSGNMVFAYQTYSWFMDLNAECDGQTYALKGNMPFTDTAGVTGQSQYDLTLTLPTEELGDDALFASTDANADLFAVADGISGQIIMKNSAFVDVDIDGETVSTPSKVEASGSITGSNVPVEVVRSFATLIAILPSTFFGA